MIDILTVIGVLSVTFQKDAVNLSYIRHSVSSTIDTLSDMKTGSNKVNEVLNILGNVPPGPGIKSRYDKVDITDNEQLRNRFNTIRNTYICRLIDNMNDRFPTDILNLLECFDLILNPSRYPSANQLTNYGTDQLSTLCTFYGNIIHRDRATAHFLQFKHFVKSYSSLTFENFLKILINDFNDQFPDFSMLAKFSLVIPVSSAPCERGFSVQNSIKTKVRNRLNPIRLNRLMFIKLVGPDLKDFDFVKAVTIFDTIKGRNQ